MKPGDYVVCVNDKNWSLYAKKCFNKLPIAGQVYRIRRIIPNITNPAGPYGVALEGIFGVWDVFIHYLGHEVYEEQHFKKMRFKKLDDATVLSTVSENVSATIIQKEVIVQKQELVLLE